MRRQSLRDSPLYFAEQWNTTCIFHSVVHSVVLNVPAQFVDIIKWDAFAEVVFYFFVHKSSVFTLVFVITVHLAGDTRSVAEPWEDFVQEL